MRIDVLTLFPEMFESPLSHSILKRAQEKDVVKIVLSNIRDFTTDSYRKVDDKPFGGGPGMVMKYEPLAAAVEVARDGEDFDEGQEVAEGALLFRIDPRPFEAALAAARA